MKLYGFGCAMGDLGCGFRGCPNNYIFVKQIYIKGRQVISQMVSPQNKVLIRNRYEKVMLCQLGGLVWDSLRCSGLVLAIPGLVWASLS